MDAKTRHTINGAEIEHILMCLRHIDRSRRQLEDLKRPELQTVIRELELCSNGIYEIVKDMPHAD